MFNLKKEWNLDLIKITIMMRNKVFIHTMFLHLNLNKGKFILKKEAFFEFFLISQGNNDFT